MRCATIAYLVSMSMTFFVCYYDGIEDGGERVGLVILLIFVQYVCMIWFIICTVGILKRIVLHFLNGVCAETCPCCKKACSCGRCPRVALSVRLGRPWAGS